MFTFKSLQWRVPGRRLATFGSLIVGLLAGGDLMGQSADTNCDCDSPVPPTNGAPAQVSAEAAASQVAPAAADGLAPVYLNPSASLEDRVNDLMPRLTLAEKVTELTDSWGSPGIPRLKIPALLKTEGLHSQSYSSGATVFPEPIAMAATFDPGS